MFEYLKRAAAAVLRFAREQEPLVVVNAAAGTVVAAVTEWQGDLTGDAAWIAVVWGVGTFVMRLFVTPAAKPTTPPGA
jgi:hypothetical protein